MNQRYNHYYEENEATINLDEITSCEGNAKILQRLRDGYESSITLAMHGQYIDRMVTDFRKPTPFIIREGMHEEVGWLGYFIGKSKCLQQLVIRYLPIGEGGQRQTRALIDHRWYR
eukprot:scaffold6045_cov77-Skeletonema_marinoi.AAC.4